MTSLPLPDFNPWLLLIAAIWSIMWKGMALWSAARRNERGWFIALLVINTLGLLEIFYIYVIARRKPLQSDPPN